MLGLRMLMWPAREFGGAPRHAANTGTNTSAETERNFWCTIADTALVFSMSPSIGAETLKQRVRNARQNFGNLRRKTARIS